MKKRHEQKLIINALTLMVLFNMPFVFMFNSDGHIWGIPIFYVVIFSLWLLSLLVSYFVLKR